MNKEFKQSILDALANPNLSGALGRFSEAYRVSRAKAYEGIDFEAVRTQIAEIKSSAASHFDELAEQFTSVAEARGTKVFRANSPQAVKDYILRLAQERGVKSIVKSKSMATGGDSSQRASGKGRHRGERDRSGRVDHSTCRTAPLAHGHARHSHDQGGGCRGLQREGRGGPEARHSEAGEVRARQTASEVSRRRHGHHRRKYRGCRDRQHRHHHQRRQCAAGDHLPRIHVAIVGLEKLIEHFADIAPILTALPQSATAQLLTSYVSIISGPVPNTDGTPKELHIILMDNRRNEMAHDPRFKQALQCIRCASCLNVCPVFRLVGGHVFGKVYTGGIGTILTAWFDALKESDEIQSLCIQCGNCKEVCPGKIDIPELILELRRRLAVEQGQPMVQKAIFSVVNNRRLFHTMLRAASIGQKPFAKQGFIRHLPMFLSSMTEFRSLPAIAEEPFRDRIKKIKQPKCAEKAAFFGGCLVDFAYPEMGEAVVKVLNKAGIEVIFPEGQTCCGAPARYSGAYEVAAQNGADNIRALLSEDVKYVVSACPTCTVALKQDFIANLEAVGRTAECPPRAGLRRRSWTSRPWPASLWSRAG